MTVCAHIASAFRLLHTFKAQFFAHRRVRRSRSADSPALDLSFGPLMEDLFSSRLRMGHDCEVTRNKKDPRAGRGAVVEAPIHRRPRELMPTKCATDASARSIRRDVSYT
jgi:hypothetical protein